MVNLDTIFIKNFNLRYWYLAWMFGNCALFSNVAISVIFSSFPSCFSTKKWILNSDGFVRKIKFRSIWIYVILNYKIIFSLYKSSFRLKIKNLWFFLNTLKVQWFCKFRWLHREHHIKIYQTKTSFHSKKDWKWIKKIYFL